MTEHFFEIHASRGFRFEEHANEILGFTGQSDVLRK